MSNQNRFHAGMSTPWGRIQDHHRIADGVVSVSTAGHGGIWLSDERIKQLPAHYQPFTGTPRWNEEDEDGALVMQYLGLLSLIPEPLELHVTAEDIDKGRKSVVGLGSRPNIIGMVRTKCGMAGRLWRLTNAKRVTTAER